MKFIFGWIGASIGLFVIFYVVFLFLAIVGPIELGDILSWEGVFWVGGLSLAVGLFILMLSGEQPLPTEELDDDELQLWTIALDRLQTHRMRILSSPHPNSRFIERELSNQVLGELATRIAKSWDTASQLGGGSTVRVQREKLAISVSTFAKSVESTQEWIHENYGSYGEYVDILRSDFNDCSADGYCHVVFGKPATKHGDSWIQMCFMPFHGNVFQSLPIMPIDLLVGELETQADADMGTSSLVCDICGEVIAKGNMLQIDSARISQLTEDGFLPKRLPRQITDLADNDQTLLKLWRATVSVNNSDWAVCKHCGHDVDKFAHGEER